MRPSSGRAVTKLLHNSQSNGRKKRINIISPTLCDDVLRRLQPSLSSTKPLDIIDINPGSCLWSSKIHQALKPRYHILVEPDMNDYKSYIDPLLHPKGSRYRHVPLLSDLFNGSGTGCLPDQTPVGPNIISKGGINDTLLVFANVPGFKAAQSKSNASAAVPNMQHYVYGMMNQHRSIHHYGMVRMFAWVTDDEKSAILPRTITDRRRTSVMLDLVAQVSEIAGGTVSEANPSKARRRHDLTIQSAQLVAERAKALGIRDPDSRRHPPPIPIWYELGLGSDALDQLRNLPHKLPWQDELLALEDSWRKSQQEVRKQSSETIKSGGTPPPKVPVRLQRLRSQYLTIRKTKAIAQDWADRQSEIDKAEVDLFTGGRSPSEHSAMREEIQLKAATLHSDMDKGRKDLGVLARRYIDDRRGFEQHPPLLQWDRRTAEPLAVKDDEFYPAKKMALLDIKPVPEALDSLNNFDKQICFQYLCHILFSNPSLSTRNALETVFQGDLDDFVERVPDLSNPLKGGNPDLNDLRVRTLPLDFLVQLALALESWPFRKQTPEMILSIRR